MNPMLILLTVLIAVFVWFLMSFLFEPIGKFFYRIWKDAVNEINDNKNDESRK